MIRKAAIFVALIATCVASGLFASGSTESASQGSSQPVTLTVWDFKYGEAAEGQSQKPMKEMDALFMKNNPNVTINHVAQPLEPQYYQIIQAAASAGKGPDVAMFHPGTRANQFDDILVDLGPYIQDVKGQFTTASIAASSNNGKVKLLPVTMQGFGFYYNKDYFKKAGLDPEKAPKSSADFLAAAEKLKAAGFVPVTVGQTYTIDFMLRAFVANDFGPNVTGLKNGSAKFTDPLFRENIEFIKTLIDKGYLEKAGYSRPYFMDGIDKFAAGGGGIFMGLLSDVGNWKVFSDKLGADNVGYFPTVNFPDSKYKDLQVAQPAGIGYGVLTWSKNPQIAADFVKFYTTGEAAKIYASGTGAMSPLTASTGLETSYPSLKVIQGYLKNTAVDYLSGVFSNYGGYEDDSNRLLDQVFVTNQLSVDDFITQYQNLLKGKE
jgi:ABC-type glycerol-3-phosphate transport system substrate-binding protein